MKLFVVFMMFLSIMNHTSQFAEKPDKPLENHLLINQLLAIDRENKRWARVYLQEMDHAFLNQDIVSYVFFLEEFYAVPLNIVPGYLRCSPNYEPEISLLEVYFRLSHERSAMEIFNKYFNYLRTKN